MPAANVQSISALETYRSALAEFAVKAGDILGGAEMTIRRTFDHLKERKRYWEHEYQKRNEEVNRIRSALGLARAMKETGKSRAGELEIELRKAIRRLREAEEKIETTTRWLRKLPDELRDYDGPAHKLRGFLEGELQQGMGVLENKVRILETYLATALPTGSVVGGGGSTAAPAAPAGAAAPAPAGNAEGSST